MVKIVEPLVALRDPAAFFAVRCPSIYANRSRVAATPASFLPRHCILGVRNPPRLHYREDAHGFAVRRQRRFHQHGPLRNGSGKKVRHFRPFRWPRCPEASRGGCRHAVSGRDDRSQGRYAYRSRRVKMDRSGWRSFRRCSTRSDPPVAPTRPLCAGGFFPGVDCRMEPIVSHQRF